MAHVTHGITLKLLLGHALVYIDPRGASFSYTLIFEFQVNLKIIVVNIFVQAIWTKLMQIQFHFNRFVRCYAIFACLMMYKCRIKPKPSNKFILLASLTPMHQVRFNVII